MPKVAKWLGDALETLMGSKMPSIKVISIDKINTHIKKIKFQGNISEMDFQLGYAVAVRVSNTEYRNYTASYNDPENGILEIIVHLHNDAPGSNFMNNLTVSDEIRISMPRGKKMYDPYISTYILFGDETTLGLACAFQNKIKTEKKSIYFFLELNNENKDIPHLLGLQNCTVHSKNTFCKNEDLINELLIFKTERWEESNFILTGNAKSVQIVRNNLRKRVSKGKIIAQAYWMEGKTGF